MPENNTEKQEPKRDDKGRWLDGESGNANGRPIGSGLSFSITKLIKEKLVEAPEGLEKETYASLLIKKIFQKALREGDTTMINRIWEYVDGRPKQSLEIEDISENKSHRGELLELIKEIRKEKDVETKTGETE